MATKKKPSALHYSCYNMQVICELRVPLQHGSTDNKYEVQRYECGDVIRSANGRSRYILIVTTFYPDDRRTSVSVFDDCAAMIYYVQCRLTELVNLYQVAEIETYNNFWHGILSAWKFVKYHIKRDHDGIY